MINYFNCLTSAFDFPRKKKLLLFFSISVSYLVICLYTAFIGYYAIDRLDYYGCEYLVPIFAYTSFVLIASFSVIERRVLSFTLKASYNLCKKHSKAKIALFSLIPIYFCCLALALALYVLPTVLYLSDNGTISHFLLLLAVIVLSPLPCLPVAAILTTVERKNKSLNVIVNLIGAMLTLTSFTLYELLFVLPVDCLFNLNVWILRISFISSFFWEAINCNTASLLLFAVVSLACGYLSYIIVLHTTKKTAHN